MLQSAGETVAEEGQVLVGQSTFEQLPKSIRTQLLGPIAVKNRDEPVVVYQVLGIDQESDGLPLVPSAERQLATSGLPHRG